MILQHEKELPGAIASPADSPLPPVWAQASAGTQSSFESRVRLIVAGALILLAMCFLGIKLLDRFGFIGADASGWPAHSLPQPLQQLLSGWSLTAMVLYPFGMLAILYLERTFPAVPAQQTLSTGLVHDALWVLIAAVVEVTLVSWFSRLLYSLYAAHLSFLTLPLAPSLPGWLRLAIGAVVLDLTRWIQHWLHHKVTWLWAFHAVHHSQRELNLFSDYRIHFMEHFVRRTVSVLPMLMLGLEAPEVMWWLLLLSWHSRLYHANIRSDFGPLRYILVTPQSHRVHHSLLKQHQDHNYGAMLSLWDYLFGTQYRRYDVYPETGIDDEDFPGESAHSVAGVLMTPVRQMLYPFGRLWKRLQRGA